MGEAGFVSGMKILFTIYRWFGRWPFRIALYPVLAWYVLTRPVARRASREYLGKLYAYSAGKTPAPNMLNVLRHFGAFAETLLDKLLVWSAPERMGLVNMEGSVIVREMMARGQGGVIMVSHIGNFELCRAMAKRRNKGMKLNIFVHTRHAERFNRLLRELAPDSQLDLIQVTDFSPATAVMLSEKVARGEFIIIAGDRVPVTQGPVLNVSFLGAEAPMPFGPYLIASMLHCPLLALIAHRDQQGTHVHVRELAAEVRLPRGKREIAAQALAQQFADELAQACCATPLQWFNFFPFWNTPEADPAPRVSPQEPA